MIHDCIENWPLYFDHPAWRRAFEFLADLSEASKEAQRVSIQGDDIYASIQSYRTAGPEGAVLEAHNRHIDVQMSLVNSEIIDWFPRSCLQSLSPYDLSGDCELFVRPGPSPVRVHNRPGFFTVLFPGDAHMPKQMAGPVPETVKKVVVKLSADLVRRCD